MADAGVTAIMDMDADQLIVQPVATRSISVDAKSMPSRSSSATTPPPAAALESAPAGLVSQLDVSNHDLLHALPSATMPPAVVELASVGTAATDGGARGAADAADDGASSYGS